MKRKVDINHFTDGHLYGPKDMVKVGCEDCAGCSACCRDMGESLVLDPLDVFRLCMALHTDFNGLMQKCIELHVVDGLILPNMNMENGGCALLNAQGRCSIHSYRPGICRLFPLGRLYRDNERGFDYILQVNECKKENRTKMKVKQWMDTPELARYDAYILKWHYFLEDLSKALDQSQDEAARKNVCMQLLNLFYVMPYDYTAGETGFYEQFENRLARVQIL